MKQDITYFINKFSAIPENQWQEGFYYQTDKKCAYGHCGVKETLAFEDWPDEAKILHKLAGTNLAYANDGVFGYEDYAPTPKHRVIKYLLALKNSK